MRSPQIPPPTAETRSLQTLRANWLNGVAKADQKAKAKSLIHLGLTQGNTDQFAKAAGVDAAKLKTVAANVAANQPVDPKDVSVLGQFDAALSGALDRPTSAATKNIGTPPSSFP